ncbi:MAG: Zn-dependent alcohol dehydrogenase [Dehalococcoidia bacterium]|jgi:S-(hydroxymethyl)glutathione dehydrogenase/alcohol dehydrogenase|nr:Zn-dependent alcohol dehydrogenase [Dehalococcoidia bacterium]
MRAAVLNEARSPMTIDELTVADPGPGEALVKVIAAGVCHSDLHFIEGTYPARMPTVLGHEVAGVVQEVGPGVTNVQAGNRVIIGFVQPCGHCEFCDAGRPNLCAVGGGVRDLRNDPALLRGDDPVTAMTNVGGFAELSLTPASGLLKIPDAVGMDVAALVGCSVMTGYGAVVNTAKVEPGTTVAVIGTGGVGLNIIQAARLAGARRIIAVDIAEHKLQYARDFGATDGVDATAGDPVQQVHELTGGGVDYAFEAIGLKQTAEQTYGMARRGGTAVIVGMVPPADQIEVSGMIWLEEKTLKGSFYGSGRFHTDMPRILDLYLAGKLDLEGLVSKRFPLDEINEAFDALRSNEVARSVLEIGAE